MQTYWNKPLLKYIALIKSVQMGKENEDNHDLTNIPFTQAELNPALGKTKMSSPGKDMLHYDKSS